MSLLFEDLFKRLNSDLKRQADAVLSKANRATQFDIAKCIRTDTITYGLESALSSGNWIIKRFRMERKGVTQVGPGDEVWEDGSDVGVDCRIKRRRVMGAFEGRGLQCQEMAGLNGSVPAPAAALSSLA